MSPWESLAILAAGLAAAAVLAWPRPDRSVRDPRPGRAGSPRPGGVAAPALPGARRRRREAALADVLVVLDLVAAALQAGATAERALALAVGQLPDGSAVRAGLSEGAGSVPDAWRRVARVCGSPEVDLVARAWDLSERLGCPLATSVDTAAALVRRATHLRSRIDTAMAGPRATMRLLTALPLAGPLLGVALGVDPIGLYWQREPTRMVTLAGLTLLAGGWWWCRSLVRAVHRP